MVGTTSSAESGHRVRRVLTQSSHPLAMGTSAFFAVTLVIDAGALQVESCVVHSETEEHVLPAVPAAGEFDTRRRATRLWRRVWRCSAPPRAH